MKAEFSEFSYGFSFTENLIRSQSSVVSAPRFLTQKQEYKLGYDLAIDLEYNNWQPLFFQFKVADILTNRRAREISRHNLNISPSFFRMKLHKKNFYSQQKALSKLGAKFPNSVFYAAPEFHECCELNRHFVNGNVHERSALFSPVDIEKACVINYYNANSNHSIAYEKNSGHGWLCSKPQEINIHKAKEIIEITDENIDILKIPTEEKMKRMTESLLNISSEHGYGITNYTIEYEIQRVHELIEEKFSDLKYHPNIPRIQVVSSFFRNCIGSDILFSLYPK